MATAKGNDLARRANLPMSRHVTPFSPSWLGLCFPGAQAQAAAGPSELQRVQDEAAALAAVLEAQAQHGQQQEDASDWVRRHTLLLSAYPNGMARTLPVFREYHEAVVQQSACSRYLAAMAALD